MAIEFNCPYCLATIRVPDAYSGKQGRCPKCDTRLLIPSVQLPSHPSGAGQLPPPAQSPRHPEEATVAAREAPGPNSSAGSENGAVPEESFSVGPQTISIARTRRKSTRLRPSRTLVIGVPVICFLVLFAIIAYSLTGSLPKLHGELSGDRLESTALLQETVFWSELSLSPTDRPLLQEALTTNPESIISQFVSCRLSAGDDGILVTLAAQPESQWIVVDVSREKPLAIWRRKEGPQWNRMRLDELRVASNQYATDKLLKVNGEHVTINPVATRDSIALNGSCGALGYVIQATADSTIFRCAAEDDLGKLYFCLPTTIRSFTIQGRKLANGSTGFNGEYTVTISGNTVITTPTSAADESVREPSDPEETSELSDANPGTSTPNTELKD